MSFFKRLSNHSTRKPVPRYPPQPNNSVGESSAHSRGVDLSSAREEEDEVLIAVVGVTGSGKSSFIKRATGRADVEIGEGLCSMTQEVKEYSYSVAGKNFKLIDTPGFDDTEIDDEDIFEALTDWLAKSYRKHQRLTGLLYLHRIISNREKGSDLRNLRVFQKLCGDQSFSNVIIGITWWDKEDVEVADAREKALKESEEFWGDMVKKGAQVVRMPLDQPGCTKLLMDLGRRHATTLAIQDEIVNQGKDAMHTTAASVLINYDKVHAAQDSDRLDRMTRDLQLKAQRLKQEQETARALAEERARYEEEDERLLAEAEALLAQKRREADAFRERTEARRKRMEEIQRQLKEAEDDIGGTRQSFTASEPASPQISDHPPPAYDSQPASRIQTPQTARAIPVEYERVRPTSKVEETRFSLPRFEQQQSDRVKTAKELQDEFDNAQRQQQEAQRLEEERRARVLAEQIQSHKKAQAEAQKRAAEKAEHERLQKIAEQKRQEEQQRAERERLRILAEQKRREEKEKEEQRIAAEAQRAAAAAAAQQQQAQDEYQQQVIDAFSELFLGTLAAQVQARAQHPAEPSREQVIISARSARHLASVKAAILQFSLYTRLSFFNRSWLGKYHEIDGVRVPGPLQDAFCDVCLTPLPNAQGYWSCHQCTMGDTGTLALCTHCKTQTEGQCFNPDHNLGFTPFSPTTSPGPFTTCVRLRQRCLFDDMSCDRCTRRLSVVFLHCCLCDNDNFDLCLSCWGTSPTSCRGVGHTMYVHVWAPPAERQVEEL